MAEDYTREDRGQKACGIPLDGQAAEKAASCIESGLFTPWSGKDVNCCMESYNLWSFGNYQKQSEKGNGKNDEKLKGSNQGMLWNV